MTIYNINLGIGWASSGVEYAQVYRASMLRNLKQDAKFVFLDFINSENIQTYTENIGFKDDEIIWLYQYFTDIKIAPTSYTTKDLMKTINAPATNIVIKGKIKTIYLGSEHTYVRCFLKNQNEDIIDRVEYVVNHKLIKKDFYTYTKLCTEYYAPDNGAKLYMRKFYNEDGTIAYREYIDKEDNLFEINDEKLYSKQEFVAYFMKSLNLTAEDIIILDRGKGVAQPIIQNKGKSRLGVVVHAEHFNETNTNENIVLWNNFYEYQFQNHRHVDFYITATERQNQKLASQFKHYLKVEPKIYTIPVGSLKRLSKHSSRRPNSLITASRLAKEKHLDWLILSVVKAKSEIEDLTFDIYGEGSQRQMLDNLIRKHNASSYIKLKGHVHLETVYHQYEVFLSGSTSEGFGLTLMEAIGSGLGMIGLNVEYGNTTFIKHMENGILVDYVHDQDDSNEVVEKLSRAIVEIFTADMNYEAASYKIAQAFLTERIEEKWHMLIEEVLND
ncbi:accessory Sec system glycosyltransferase GtfA [Macrococcoides canis]|uniref:accessory Sec system glycosyltransferase GtfA n=1 Tax=Macrococcoides canis TaxID=1855823 RepID=UPI0020B6D6A5|nr:accessory Sec system glycosyltransferase GtfA [Macrococcus canis]UTG99925.1 accessory Sec system glycosyltransferase GtfA [Macrococcus canis]